MEYYQAQYYDEALQHYGVKGMKWGVRRRQRQTARRVKKVDKKINKLKKREGKQNARIVKDLSTRGSTTINPFNDPDITSGKIKYNKVKRASIKAGDNARTRKLKLKKEALSQRINKVNQSVARTGTISSTTYRQYQKDWDALNTVEKKLSQKKKKK